MKKSTFKIISIFLIFIFYITKINAQLPGNTSLPTADIALNELAKLDSSDYKYSVEDLKFSLDGKYIWFKIEQR